MQRARTGFRARGTIAFLTGWICLNLDLRNTNVQQYTSVSVTSSVQLLLVCYLPGCATAGTRLAECGLYWGINVQQVELFSSERRDQFWWRGWWCAGGCRTGKWDAPSCTHYDIYHKFKRCENNVHLIVCCCTWNDALNCKLLISDNNFLQFVRIF